MSPREPTAPPVMPFCRWWVRMDAVDRGFVVLLVVVWLASFLTFSSFAVDAITNWQNDQIVVALLFGSILAAILASAVATPLRIAINLLLKDRRRTHRSETALLIGLVLLTTGWLLEEIREKSRLAPPTGVTTFPEFAKSRPEPRRLELVETADGSWIAWYGELAGPLAIPSGPSCYLFDRTGRLVGWQSETGDGGSVEDIIDRATLRQAMHLSEALDWFEKETGD